MDTLAQLKELREAATEFLKGSRHEGHHVFNMDQSKKDGTLDCLECKSSYETRKARLVKAIEESR